MSANFWFATAKLLHFFELRKNNTNKNYHFQKYRTLYLCMSEIFSNFAAYSPIQIDKAEKLNQYRMMKEMENRRFEGKNEPEIVYSRSVKAGKRIYYLDVKKARNEDLYLCITESKRKQTGETEPPQFEKHKVFLYKEDFAHFTEGLNDVISFVQSQLGNIEERQEWTPETDTTATTEATAEKPAEEKHEDKSILGSILNRLKS